MQSNNTAMTGEQDETITRQNGFGSIFSFQGRIPRSTFWITVISIFILSQLFKIFILTSDFRARDIIIGLNILYLIPVVWILLATYVKRWHDINKSGWYTLLLFIPFVNLGILLFLGIMPGSKGYNQFGEDPLLLKPGTAASEELKSKGFVSATDAFYRSADHIKKGRIEKAMEMLRLAIEADAPPREKAALFYNLAVCYNRSGDKQPAKDALDKAIEIQPSLGETARRDKDLKDVGTVEHG